MKLIVLRNNLKAGVDAVSRAVGQSFNLPVLNNVLIKAADNRISLSSTNLEMAITRDVLGKIIEEGGVAVPYSTLANIVNNISSERINLETTKQGNLVLKSDNYEANLQSANQDEFPAISRIETKEESALVNSLALREGLSKVIIASEASDLRPEISGILFLGELTNLKLVATDSFRLAEAKISGQQFKNNLNQGFRFTIPLKTAQELTRVIKEDEESLFYTEKNQFLFRTEELALTSRLIEGEFPNYESIIPKEVDTEILVDRSELVGALRLASTFVSRTNDVKLKTKDKKILEVYSSDNAVGENSYLIPAKVEGLETEIAFHWRYLLDGLKGSSTKQVSLGLNGSDRAAIIRNPGDESSFYILMPIKTS